MAYDCYRQTKSPVRKVNEAFKALVKLFIYLITTIFFVAMKPPVCNL